MGQNNKDKNYFRNKLTFCGILFFGFYYYIYLRYVFFHYYIYFISVQYFNIDAI